MSHFLFNSSTDITDIFKAMYPDSAIAQKLSQQAILLDLFWHCTIF